MNNVKTLTYSLPQRFIIQNWYSSSIPALGPTVTISPMMSLKVSDSETPQPPVLVFLENLKIQESLEEIKYKKSI